MPLAVQRMKVSSYLMLQESFDSEENGGRASQRSGREGWLLARASARERSWHDGEMQLRSSKTGLESWRDCGKVLRGSQLGTRVCSKERETRARGHLVLDHHASHVQISLCHLSLKHGDVCIMAWIWWAKARKHTSD